MIVENGQILEIDLSNQIFAWVFAFGAVACIVVFIFNKISCYNDARHDEDGNFDGGGVSCAQTVCCQAVLDSFCAIKDKDMFEPDYAETVRSMDISDSGCESRHLPVEVNSAALATAQFLQAESSLNNLSPGDRARLAENRQVMKAYLISKLVAPRYAVDNTGKILPELNSDNGHMDRFEFNDRQSKMFHLVFNGQISVDTRATKRQQREAIKRLKKSSRERHLEKHMEKNEKISSKVSISEKETSGVGTDLNSNPPITTPKKAATRQPEKKKKEKPVKPVTRQNTTTSGTSVSSNNSRRPPILQRLASAIRLRGPDSAVGSSIGQYDADIESMDRGRRPTKVSTETEMISTGSKNRKSTAQKPEVNRSSSLKTGSVLTGSVPEERKPSDLPTKWSSAIDLPVSH